jgi:hypothetical protein
VAEGDVDSRGAGPLAGVVERRCARVHARRHGAAAGELERQPAGSAAEIERRFRRSGRFQDLGHAERQGRRQIFTTPTPQFHP